MILTFILLFMMALAVSLESLMTVEGLASTVIGALLSWGLANWLKGKTGLAGLMATILTGVICIAVAVAAIIVTTFIKGEPITFELIATQSAYIFTTATFVYRIVQSAINKDS